MYDFCGIYFILGVFLKNFIMYYFGVLFFIWIWKMDLNFGFEIYFGEVLKELIFFFFWYMKRGLLLEVIKLSIY